MTMHPDDAKDEADVHLVAAQALAAIKPDACVTSQVYGLLMAAAMASTDQEFLEHAFQEVVIFRQRRLKT